MPAKSRRKATPEPDPQTEGQALLEAYPSEFLTCRSDRHDWERQAHWQTVAINVAERYTVCRTCGTERVQTVNTRGWYQIGGLKYRYAPGYRTPRSGLTLGDFRTRFFQADFTQATKSKRVAG